MLSAPPRTPRPTAASQAGFTLVELLVAMSIGLVVMFAVTAIMIVSLHQTQRTFTSVDATRQARTALATIEKMSCTRLASTATPQCRRQATAAA